VSDKVKFELPAVGVTAAFRPCSECYEILEREGRHTPGARYECISCRNVLLARIVEKTVEPIADRFRPFDATSRIDSLADVMFSDSRFDEATAKTWLEAHGLEGFAEKGRDARIKKFFRFSKDESAAVDMYVRLDKGVIGRCTAKEVKFTFTGSGV
jgi:hypothetical protein